MDRKRITPAIKGEFEYMVDEEGTSKFDKYQIRVGDTLVAFLYMPRKFHLLPQSITFTEELEVYDVY